jgi:hypothetical protein
MYIKKKKNGKKQQKKKKKKKKKKKRVQLLPTSTANHVQKSRIFQPEERKANWA